MREFHKDFFWIYGVIVGLAIREALTQTLHHVFSIPALPPQNHHQHTAIQGPIQWRLAVSHKKF
jgi:hypothetical protein